MSGSTRLRPLIQSAWNSTTTTTTTATRSASSWRVQATRCYTTLSRPLPFAVSSRLHSPISSTVSSSPSPSSLPLRTLALRIRTASTTSSKSSSVVSEQEKQKRTIEDEADKEDGVEGKKAEKIKMGEVKRLAILAKPERKTIGIAIGLVS